MEKHGVTTEENLPPDNVKQASTPGCGSDITSLAAEAVAETTKQKSGQAKEAETQSFMGQSWQVTKK